MTMKVTKQKVDWAETKVTVETGDSTLNFLTIKWDGRTITVNQYWDNEIKVFVNGASCDINTEIVELYPANDNTNRNAVNGAVITLKKRQEK